MVFYSMQFLYSKKKGTLERVLIKISFRYKMMAIFFHAATGNNLLKSFTSAELQD